MTAYDLRERTKYLALRVIRLCGSLPNSREAEVNGRQLLRSGTSLIDETWSTRRYHYNHH
jgi:hypothetical protein